MVRLDRQRLVVALHGLLLATHCTESNAAVVQRLGIARLDRQRLVVALHGLLLATPCTESGAAVAQRLDIVRLDRQRLVDQANTLFVMPPLNLDRAQQMKGVRMIGIRTEDRFVKALSLDKIASSVRRHRSPKRLWQCQLELNLGHLWHPPDTFGIELFDGR